MASRDESKYRVRTESGVEFHTKRVLFDDLAVVIRRFPLVEGAPTGGRPFVLVHGIGVSSRYFHPTAAQLARHGTVFLVDLPGYGSAPDPRRDVSIADHAGVLARYLDADEIEKPVLVGHSMGTQVVSQLAFDYPETTDRIVLIAPTMDSAARGFWTAAGRLIRDSLFREPLAVKLLNLTDYLFRCGIPYFLRQVPHLLADRIEDRLPLLRAKGLVIRGDRDGICPEPWSRRVASLLGNAPFETVAGPHVVMFTDPARIATLIAGHRDS
jgi:pimeloyl-ACP methyl ester carboxylesterase